jgi:predicted DNA binding protein
MRRLVIEFPKSEFSKVEGNSKVLQDVKTMEVLMFLRHTDEEITMICRVELETEVSDVQDYIKLVSDNAYQVQFLERENSGAYVVLVKHKIHKSGQLRVIGNALWEKGAYVVAREMWSGKFRMTFLGNVNQIKNTLKTLDTTGIRHRILSMTDAKFTPNSPLNALTEKQRRILIAAYKLGYYDLPRKISSRQLSERLGLHKSALATHRRKAELRLLASVLSELR